jgi:hypothetical protein
MIQVPLIQHTLRRSLAARVHPLAKRQSPDMKPKKRRGFVSFFDPLAGSNHCSASLDQNRRSSTSTAAAANLPHSWALVRRNFSASNI